VPRGWAIATVTGAAAAAMAGIGWVLVPALADAARALLENGPEYVRTLRGEGWVRWLDEQVGLMEAARRAGTRFLEGSGGPLGVAQAAAGWVFAWVTVVLLMILFLMYGREMRRWIVGRWVAPARRDDVMGFTGRVAAVVSGYLVGNLAVSVVAGAVSWTGLWLLGVPYAPVLALWIAIADLIPLVGATLGAIPAIAAAATVSWPVAIGTLVLLVGYQQAENHLVQPIAMRWAVRLNPLTTVVAVLIGAELMGIIGALVAIPVAGIIQLMIREGGFGVDRGAGEQGDAAHPQPDQDDHDRRDRSPGALVRPGEAHVQRESGRRDEPYGDRSDPPRRQQP